MKHLAMTLLVSAALTCAATSAALGGNPVWHDPWLNWDFINQDPWNIANSIVVNDFAVIVDDPTGTFNPNPNDPNQQWAAPFPNFQTFQADYDGDGDLDRMLKWSGADVPVGTPAHGGLYMKNSGRVLDAYFTKDCNKVYCSVPITYELTEIRGDPEVHMHLQIAPGYFNDPDHPDAPYQEAGWTNIRTFVNLPSDMLNLPHLTRDLDLNDPSLLALEVTPIDAKTGLPILPTDIIWGEPDSFFDVFLGQIDPAYSNENYEALLHAEVVNQGQTVGEFWNLNRQSPEPGTLALLGVGACLALLRRRR